MRPGSTSLRALRLALAAPRPASRWRSRSRAAAAPSHPVAAAPPAKAPPAPPPLDGVSYDYDYDGSDVGHPERRWMGRVFVHRMAAALAGQPLPVLVFLHGNNPEGIKYRWMGGGPEGDIRRIVSELMEAGQVPPLIVAVAELRSTRTR